MKKVGEAGSLLVEALAMLGLISMVTPVVYKKSAERMMEMQDINSASQMRTLSNALDAYLSDHYLSLVAEDHTITASDLESYLPAGSVADGTLYGFADNYTFSYTRTTPPGCTNCKTVLIGYVGAEVGEGSSIDEKRASRIATMIGSNGGYVATEGSGEDEKHVVYGAQGVWEVDADDIGMPETNNSIVATSIAAINDSARVDTTEFLYRHYQDDRELNTMYTTLYMNGNDNSSSVATMQDIQGVRRLLIGANDANGKYAAQNYDATGSYSLYVGAAGGANGSAYIADTLTAAKDTFQVSDSQMRYYTPETYVDWRGRTQYTQFKSEFSIDKQSLSFSPREHIYNGYRSRRGEFKITPKGIEYTTPDNQNHGFRMNNKNFRVRTKNDTNFEVGKGMIYMKDGGDGRFLLKNGQISARATKNISIEGEQKISAKSRKAFNIAAGGGLQVNAAKSIQLKLRSNSRTADGTELSSLSMNKSKVSLKYAKSSTYNYTNWCSRWNATTSSYESYPCGGGSYSATRDKSFVNLNSNGVDMRSVDGGTTYSSLNISRVGRAGLIRAVARNKNSSDGVILDMKGNEGKFDIAVRNDHSYHTSTLSMANDETALIQYRTREKGSGKRDPKYKASKSAAAKIIMGNSGISIEGGEHTTDWSNDGGSISITAQHGGSIRNTVNNGGYGRGGNIYNNVSYGDIRNTVSRGNVSTNVNYGNISNYAYSGGISNTTYYGNMTNEIYGGGSFNTSVYSDGAINMNTSSGNINMTSTSGDIVLSAGRGRYGSTYYTGSYYPYDNYYRNSYQNTSSNTFTLYSRNFTVDDSTGGSNGDSAWVRIRRGAIEVLTDTSGGKSAASGTGYIRADRFVVDNKVDPRSGTSRDPRTVWVNSNRVSAGTGATSNPSNPYDHYMVDPAYTSVMHDIKLTSRGGARLSDILPDFINKGIYVVDNSYSEGCTEGPDNSQASGFNCTGSTSAYASHYLGNVPAPQCPPGYAKVITLSPVGFRVAQIGKVITDTSTGRGYLYPLDNAVAYKAAGDKENYLNVTEGEIIEEGEPAESILVKNGPDEVNYTATITNLAQKTQNTLDELARSIDRVMQSSTYLKAAIKTQRSTTQQTAQSSLTVGTETKQEFLGWATYMGFVYPINEWNDVVKELTGKYDTDVESFTNGIYWNLFPILKYSLEGYATVYCYFDRGGLLNNGVSYFNGSLVDTKYNQFSSNRRSVTPGSPKYKNNDTTYVNRLNNPKLIYNDEW